VSNSFLDRPCSSVKLKTPAFSDNSAGHANVGVSQPSVCHKSVRQLSHFSFQEHE
jgi:hypothetical protein